MNIRIKLHYERELSGEDPIATTLKEGVEKFREEKSTLIGYKVERPAKGIKHVDVQINPDYEKGLGPVEYLALAEELGEITGAKAIDVAVPGILGKVQRSHKETVRKEISYSPADVIEGLESRLNEKSSYSLANLSLFFYPSTEVVDASLESSTAYQASHHINRFVAETNELTDHRLHTYGSEPTGTMKSRIDSTTGPRVHNKGHVTIEKDIRYPSMRISTGNLPALLKRLKHRNGLKTTRRYDLKARFELKS